MVLLSELATIYTLLVMFLQVKMVNKWSLTTTWTLCRCEWGKVQLIGADQPVDSAEEYNPSTNSWTVSWKLPVPLYGLMLIVVCALSSFISNSVHRSSVFFVFVFQLRAYYSGLVLSDNCLRSCMHHSAQSAAPSPLFGSRGFCIDGV
jgi:hypothetical protein